MNEPMQSQLPDPDMQAAPRALLRAARRAQELAKSTGTALVVIRDGVVVEENVSQSELESGVESKTSK